MYSDYQILYSLKVQNKLDDFIDYMSQTCRYRDSWIYNEDVIVENFVNDIKLFIREVKTITENKIKSWIIWQIASQNKDFIETQLVVFIRSYHIVYKCLIVKNEKIIVLEDISIKT